MLYHLKIFLRNLRKNYTCSGINIVGLSIGITASVLIFLWVYHERSFDTCYPDTKRIYRIINTDKQDVGSIESRTSASVSLPFVRACESGIPEIEDVAFNLSSGLIKSVKINNDFFFLKPDDAITINRAWLEMFNGSLLDGSFDEYDNHPFSVALTETAAKKYFGNLQPIGQIVRVNDADYTVQAVVKDNPLNSSFRYQLMFSSDAELSDENKQYLNRWVVGGAKTFVKLRPDADVLQVTQKMNDILANNNIHKEVRLELLTDMYFSDVKGTVNGNAQMVSIFSLLGILLLCIACINYINLTTARVTHRTKEVGIKKIVGAKRHALFLQFVSETFILSFVATVIALFLIRALTPLYQTLVGNTPVSFSSPVVWTVTSITLLFVTVLNGVYPALMLSSFHPVNVLKGISFPKIKNSNLRKMLVVFQFSMSAALIISVIVIFSQTRYIQNFDPGFRKDHIVRINIPSESFYQSNNRTLLVQTFKGEIQSCPDIVSASSSLGNIENNRLEVTGSDGIEYFHFDPISVDEDFINVFELQLSGGRWFNTGEADDNNFVLNETAVRELQIEEPIGQQFEFMGRKGDIIGVVKDFHFRSLHEKIGALVICQQKQFNGTLNIKIQEGKTAEAVGEIETVWNRFFPDDPFDYVFVDDAYTNLYRSDFLTSRMILVFSILTIVIAALGLFGLSTFAIERRIKEIGIRKVLGASASNIVQLITREFIILVAIAFVIAAPVAWWAMSKWLDNFAYRIDLTVWIFVSGAVVTLVIALIAVGVQAVKAATANPVDAIAKT